MRKLRSFLNRIPRGPVRRSFLAEWIVNLIVLLFGWTTLLQAYVIPSGSMENSLLVGDHVFVNRLVYSPSDAATKHLLPYRDVQRGDIIVFRYPLNIQRELVKRAIGVPGDRIRFVHKQLILNGKVVMEPYAHHIGLDVDPYRDNFPAAPPDFRVRPRALEMLQANVVDGELVVPSGSIFAMGDNREDSDDSRYWGLVPRQSIEGTPFLIYWSFDAPTEDLMNPNIGVDHVVDIVGHFFTKTRWNRTLRLIRPYPLGS